MRHMILIAALHRRVPRDDPFDAALIDDALDMATAALSAPVSKAVRAMLKKTTAPGRCEARRPKSPA